MTTYRLRRFAGFTPHNVIDRISDQRQSRMSGRDRWAFSKLTARYSHYGVLRDADLFRALSSFRGAPYHAGKVGRSR